jgi:hypothetical protein
MVIFKEKPILIIMALTGGLFLLSLLLVSFNVAGFSSPVILHFDVFRGIDLFGEKIDVWVFLLTAFLIGFLNIILGEAFFYRQRLLAYLLISANLLFALLTLVAVGVIVTVN